MKANSVRGSQFTKETLEKPNINYAEALRKLKEVERKLEQRKKQIKAQGLRSQRGRWHADEIQKRAQMQQNAKDEAQKLQNQYAMMKAKQLQKIARLKQQGQRMRQEKLKKRSMGHLQLLQNKIRLKREVREQSLNHTEQIIHLRQLDLQKKRDRRLSMYGSRKQSRLSIQQFKTSRINLIRSGSSRERDALLQKLNARQKQLCDLECLQTESSRVNKGKVDKEHSTAQNLKSIDSSMRIYNPSSSKRKTRKRSLSDRHFLGDSSLITQI